MSSRKPRKGGSPARPKEPGGGFKSQPGRKRWIASQRTLLFGAGCLCLVAAMLILVRARHGTESKSARSGADEPENPDAPYARRSPGTVTFNKDVASIIFNRCAPCHHSGQPAPFELLTYRDVARRARQIVEVTQSTYMPPWLPEHGFGRFANERRLTADEKGLLQQWVTEGAPEGTSAPLPAPHFPEGWILGLPDLVVTMPDEYALGAEGTDVYRNFVIPVPGSQDRFVRALEFSPGNSRIVHHAFIKVDAKRASRLLDAQDAEPGFPGMSVPAETPNGQFLSWQPGKLPSIAPEGLSWLLPGNSDLIVQLHMNRSGKPERIRPSIGLYFTNTPPIKTCVRATLTSLALDIPAGESNYVVTDTLTLPVEVQVLSILPHAHYLAKEIQSFAQLPDGTKKWLLFIKRWNFNWQRDYQYAEPVRLPKGATVHLRFTYDNSTNNLRNPNPTPKRVMYGPQSSDEMCELWFQMLPNNEKEAAALKQSLNQHMQGVFQSGAEHRLAIDPNDARAHTELGIFLFGAGDNRQAVTHLARAIQIDPTLDKPHYEMGVILRSEHRLEESRAELETALRLNPNNAQAYGHLGFIFADQNDADNAERCFRRCLELDPTDSQIQEALRELQQVLRNRQRR
jgi:hypothetical protein